MSRLKNSDPPISLFSFQDIITSLTGVLFLVMILLALFLCSSYELSPQRAGTAAVDRRRRELNAEIAAAQQRLAEIRRLLDSQGGADRARLAVRLQVLHAEQKKLDELSAALRREAASAANRVASVKEDLEERQSRAAELQKQLDLVQKRLQKLLASQKKSEEKIRFSQTVQKFRLAPSDLGSPFFLLLKKDGVTFSDPVSGESRTFDRSADANWQVLNDFLFTKMSGSRYLLLFVQPGAFSYYPALQLMCRRARWQYGAEVLPDDRTEIRVEQGNTP